MTVVGVTIVRDAVRLEYPILAAINSILPLVDEMVVNVGRSSDGTIDLIERACSGDNIHVLDREWDQSLGGAVLAHETNIAMKYRSSDWIVYVQADEMLHEDGLPLIRETMVRHAHDDRVQGLLVDFKHHYGSPDLLATSRAWYRREVRIVKTRSGAQSHHEAQGFRVGEQRIQAVRSGGTFHHYGWARSAEALGAKSEADNEIYGRKAPRTYGALPWEYGLRPFSGSHPAAAAGWLTEMEGRYPGVGPRRWSLRQARMVISDVLERGTGRRWWEYKNYDLID